MVNMPIEMPSPLQDFGNSCQGSLAENSAPLTLFIALINSLYTAQCNLKPPLIESTVLEDGDTFDYIIVGAGSAGCVIANRLSQDLKTTVLLLEAGDNPPVISEIPRFWKALIDSSSDWSFKTVPQRNACLGFKDQVCHISAGMVLGGSSSIDSTVYLRGTKEDYEHWKHLETEELLWPNILNTYKKLENNLEFGADDTHGNEGELKVDDLIYTHSFQDLISNATIEMGYEELIDMNEGNRKGWGSAQGTKYEGKRMSAYKAFIVPIKDRPNLYISTKSYVTKVLIENFNKTAYGVEIYKNNRFINIYAKNEVIISAGAINSPKLLLLSGLGHWEHLQELKIPIVENLSVGQHLMDQVSYIGFFVVLKSEKCHIKNEDILDSVYQYYQYLKGPLTSIGSESFMGFFHTEKDKNIQIKHVFFDIGELAADPKSMKRFRLETSIINTILEANMIYPIILFIPTLLRPQSMGYLKLVSNNPFDLPIINPNYLYEENDSKQLIASIIFLKHLIATETFKKCNPEIIDLKLSQCLMHKHASKNYFMCSLKYLTTSADHVCGTVKMGLRSDPTAVVNSKMQVYGVRRLRVVGSSIYPTIVTDAGAGSSMIGELAANFITEFDLDE